MKEYVETSYFVKNIVGERGQDEEEQNGRDIKEELTAGEDRKEEVKEKKRDWQIVSGGKTCVMEEVEEVIKELLES